jgi:hypothetical protein
MTLRPHHGRVAAAILGILIESGRLAGPCSVDLPRLLDDLRADGGVLLDRDESVCWAMAFIRRSGGLEDGEDDAEILEMLAEGHDELRTRLGVDIDRHWRP